MSEAPTDQSIPLTLKVMRTHPEAVLPEFATAGAACFDIHAIVQGHSGDGKREAWVNPMQPMTFRTGLAVQVPTGHVLLIFSRSGMGFKRDMRLANCVGVIDSDYRGEIHVKITKDPIYGGSYNGVAHHDRIAQAMLLRLPSFQIEEVTELDTTERGTGGFGSTGA